MLQDIILLLKIHMGMRKDFFEIYRESKMFAIPALKYMCESTNLHGFKPR